LIAKRRFRARDMRDNGLERSGIRDQAAGKPGDQKP